VLRLPFRPERIFKGLKAPAHGGVHQLKDSELKLLGIDPRDVLDFSVCTNPFMPPPGVKEMMSALPIEQYPDSQSVELRCALSEKLGVSMDNILAGSGTTELIRLVALAYIRPGNPVLILEPTYSEYEAAARLSGARLIKYRADEIVGFTPDMDEFIGIIRDKQPRAVFICNPNNPTGKYLSRQGIVAVLDNLGDGLLVLDEAYVAFTGESWDSLDLAGRGNAVVLRSMTKDYGLPGLRLGYAVACREITDSLRAVAPPWNVNTVAQKVGVTVLARGEYLRQSLRQVREAGRFLAAEIARLGFKVMPSDTHYFLVKVGKAPEVRRSLLKKGILVRDCASFGLPHYVRVSPRTMPDCIKLVEAFGGVAAAGGD
jgi:histidinol-phosphate aminotransferase